jgi:hypothetical protein
MSRPDPIEYAERLFAAIRDANFSTISFLAFGNAVKDGVALRRMPRIAAEPFMRVVGEMLDLEEANESIIDSDVNGATTVVAYVPQSLDVPDHPAAKGPNVPVSKSPVAPDVVVKRPDAAYHDEGGTTGATTSREDPPMPETSERRETS